MHGLIVDPAISEVAASNDGRKTRGRPFQPGNKMGRGRPAGSRNRATLILDTLAEGEAETLLKTILEQAKAGDTRAAEIVLNGRNDRLDHLPDAAGEDCIVLDHGDGGLDGATATVTQYDATSGIHRSAGERRSRKRTPTVTRLRTSAEPILMEPLHQNVSGSSAPATISTTAESTGSWMPDRGALSPGRSKRDVSAAAVAVGRKQGGQALTTPHPA